jgi:hypothetical protein
MKSRPVSENALESVFKFRRQVCARLNRGPESSCVLIAEETNHTGKAVSGNHSGV